MGGTGRRIGRLSALAELPGYCTRPSATANAARHRQQPFLQRGANEDAGDTAGAVESLWRGDAATMLKVRAWWCISTSDQREVDTLTFGQWVIYTGRSRSCVWRGVEMWHLLGVCRRWHGPSSNGLRGSHRGSTGCNLFRDAALCAARERLARSRPLSSRVSTAVREVGCLRRRGDPWAHCGRPQRSGMDTVCPVAAAVAAGRSRAMLRDATWVRQEILAF